MDQLKQNRTAQGLNFQPKSGENMVYEDKYKSIIDHMLDGVYQTTPDGKFLMVNRAFVKILGYDSEEEVLGLNIYEDLYINPQDRKDWMELLEKSGELSNIEIKFKKKNSDHVIVLDNSRAVYDESGHLAYYEGIITDITHLKRTTQELKNNKDNLRALIENTDDLIWSINTDYKLEIYNSNFFNFCSLKGCKVSKGMNILEATRNNLQLQNNWKSHYDRALDGEHFNLEIRTQWGQKEKDMHVSFNPIVSEDGKIKGVSIFAYDITTTKKSLEALQASESRYRLLVENAPVGIVMVNSDGSISSSNPQFRSILELSEKFLEDVNFFDFPAFIKAGITKDFKQVINSGRSLVDEKVFRTSQGDKKYLHYVLTPIRDDSGEINGIQAIVEDITEGRKASDQLFESYKYLGVVNRKLGILLNIGKEQSTKDNQEILDFILNSASELSGADEVIIYKHNESLKRLNMIASRNSHIELPVSFLTIEKCSIIEKLVYERIRIQRNQFDSDIQSLIREKDVKYIVGMPLLSNQNTCGVIFFGFRNERELTTQELDFLEVFAMQATYALVNAQIL